MKKNCLVVGLAALTVSDVASMDGVCEFSGKEIHHSYEILRDAYNHVRECRHPQVINTLKPLFSDDRRYVDALTQDERAFAIGLIANSHYCMNDFEKASSYYYSMLSGDLFHHIGLCYEIDGFCDDLVKPVREWDYFSKYRTKMNEQVMFLINSSDAFSKIGRTDYAIDCLEQLFVKNQDECNREGTECYADFICGFDTTMKALNSLFKLYDQTDQYPRAREYAWANVDILQRMLEECSQSFENSVIFRYFIME
ncbi:hypothetical protein FACS189449_00080 [Alphaproteobacteria bacterium]|nr:hypothetical protein FACS189449_00080 [Alphaproteobacteria bacterium]